MNEPRQYTAREWQQLSKEIDRAMEPYLREPTLIARASRHNPKLYLRKPEPHWNRLLLVLILAAVVFIALGTWALLSL